MKKILSMVLALLLLCTACGGFRDKESAVLYGYGADGAAAQRIGACYGVTAADAPAAEGMADILEAAQQQAVIDAVAEDKYGIGYIYSMTAEDSDAVKEIEITDAPALQIMVARRDDYAADTLEVDFYHFLINVVGQEIAEEMGYTGLVEMPLAMCGACVKPAGKLTMLVQPGLEPLALALREKYYGYNKQADITILTAEDAWTRLEKDECAIVMGYNSEFVSMPLFDDTMKTDLLGEADFRVIVNAKNPVESLSAEQFAAILAGDTPAWETLLP